MLKILRLTTAFFGYILIFMKTAAIILNTPDEIGEITESDVICADNGLSRIHVTPVAVVGDLDSLENRKDGLNYVVFPKEKDETDGQLALLYAKSAGYDAVTIYGATGGDIGQILGNIGLLKYAKDIKIDARISGVGFDIKLVEGKVSDTAFINQKISLFPFFGDALVTNSRGLYYPLENLLLSAGTNRGLSNVATANEISFTVESGILLMIKYY